MEKTRVNIFAQIFESFKSILFTNTKDSITDIPTMSDLKSSDWDGISEKNKLEILKNSPKRILGIFNEIIGKVKDSIAKTPFASRVMKKGNRIQNDTKTQETIEEEDIELQIRGN